MPSVSQLVLKNGLTRRHLLIIGVLALAFSISFLIRFQPADFGYELNEFDPFFNYRATEFLVNNGMQEYREWHDAKSWHPQGRDISATSQNMLHITAAVFYQAFGFGASLYDFTIIFPVVFGSLTAVVVFALVRVIGGTSAGLFAALLYSVSVPVIIRGMLGWFKSEPLGLFYGCLGVYLFLSGIKSENHRIAALKLGGAGIFVAFGLASWGGVQFFLIPLGMFFLALPFLRSDRRFQMWSIPLFVSVLLLVTMVFERPGADFVFGIEGLFIAGTALFTVACNAIQRISPPARQLRNGILFLGGVVSAGIALTAVIFTYKTVSIPSFRYLNAVNPFLTTVDPLTDSIAEHATNTLAHSFYFLSILMVFAGIGIWIILSKKRHGLLREKPDLLAFALIFGLVGVYVSSAFIRLELFASIATILFASLGISRLLSLIFRRRPDPAVPQNRSLPAKVLFCAGMVILLTSPLLIPAEGNWIDISHLPPTLLTGGSSFGGVYSDWPDALNWLLTSTPPDSVVAAWWDYGYWITTVSDRTTLADNATIGKASIQKIAQIFLSTPDDAWRMLQDFGADYVLVFVTSQKITSETGVPLYVLAGGGDESKKQWFIRIAGEPESKYLYPDGFSGTAYFWENTTLGKMFPYYPAVYYNPSTQQQSDTYRDGFTPFYVKNIKFPQDGDGPLRLVYASPSYLSDDATASPGVFIYEVNKDYSP